MQIYQQSVSIAQIGGVAAVVPDRFVTQPQVDFGLLVLSFSRVQADLLLGLWAETGKPVDMV